MTSHPKLKQKKKDILLVEVPSAETKPTPAFVGVLFLMFEEFVGLYRADSTSLYLSHIVGQQPRYTLLTLVEVLFLIKKLVVQ